MLSARKEGHSAHVEISKMDVQDEGGEERTAPKPRRRSARALLTLTEARGQRVPWSIFIYMQARAWAFPTFSLL